MNKFKLTYFGSLRSTTSWAKVGREIILGLIDLGVKVNIYERKGFLYHSDFPLPSKMNSCITNRFHKDGLVLTFEYPDNYKYLKGKRKVGILTWETTSVPKKWVENVNRYLDLLIVPSFFCFKAFRKSGVKIDTLILPHGFNPKIFNQNAVPVQLPTGKRFIFLTIALPHKREGIDILLKSYKKAFNSKDDVSLYIKTSYMPRRKKKLFEYKDLKGMIENFKKDKRNPEVILAVEALKEEEIAGLYTASSAYVSASRGEGFGICLLEALACGKPVISTSWGGTEDFLNHENAYLVDYKLVEAGNMQYDSNDKGSLLAEPDTDNLAEKMRAVFENYEDAVKKADRFKEMLPKYTWEKVVRQFMNILKRLRT